MKYESELIKEIVDSRGHKKSSLHYQSECVESWIEETKGAYPKLCDYESEWLNYINDDDEPIGEFPYITLTDVTEATVDNVVPYAYKSAILKGQTTDTIIDFTESFTIQNTIKDFNFLFSPKLNKKYMLTLELTNVTPRNGESDYITVRGVKEDGGYDTLTKVTQSYTNGVYEIPCEFTKNYSKIRIAVSFKATIVNMKLKGELISVEMPVLTTSNEDGTKTNILTVNEPIELRGIGDLKDTLNCNTGECIERVISFVLDETKNYYNFTENEKTVRVSITTSNLKTKAGGNVFSPMFPKISSSRDEEHIRLDNSSPYSNLVIGLNKSRLTEVSLQGVKQFFQQNSHEILLELAEPVIKTVELTVVNQDGESMSKIKPIEGTMHLSTSSSTIPPLFSGEIPVEAITQNLAAFIEEE